jgi:eukaryotic-like serine/threonine-protein kinase
VDHRVFAGRYRLESPLGQSAMAEVWLAHDEELDRPVALKLLAPTADRARFRREAHAAAALAHPNVTRLYDYGEADGRLFMALEYLPGGTLEDRLPKGQRLPDVETAAIAAQLADGLAQAHERGLVHRDVKPANVLFDDEDRPKLADFGIARIAGGDTITETGTVIGTAAYISPEQATGERVGPASDVYSFGVLLYRMLTGRLPFESESAVELAQMHVQAQAPPIEVVRPDVPRDLAAVATAALAKDPSRRPKDGAALAARLDARSAGIEATGTPTVVLPRAGLRPRPRRVPALAAALVLLAAAGAAVAVVLTRHSSSNAPAIVSTPSARTDTTATTAPSASTATQQTSSSTSTAPPTTSATTTATTPPTVSTTPSTIIPPSTESTTDTIGTTTG